MPWIYHGEGSQALASIPQFGPFSPVLNACPSFIRCLLVAPSTSLRLIEATAVAYTYPSRKLPQSFYSAGVANMRDISPSMIAVLEPAALLEAIRPALILSKTLG